MKISSNFNRLYHALLKEAKGLKMMRVDFGDDVFELRPRAIGYSSFKQLMKALNEEYPRGDKGKPISTMDITSKELTTHTEWLINVVYANGGKIRHIEEEFKRIFERENNGI